MSCRKALRGLSALTPLHPRPSLCTLMPDSSSRMPCSLARACECGTVKFAFMSLNFPACRCVDRRKRSRHISCIEAGWCKRRWFVVRQRARRAQDAFCSCKRTCNRHLLVGVNHVLHQGGGILHATKRKYQGGDEPGRVWGTGGIAKVTTGQPAALLWAVPCLECLRMCKR